MSTTFAQLGIEFTTRTAAKAANDIDKVERAADRAEKRTDALSGKSKRLATDMATGAKGVRRATGALNKMHGGAKRATDGIELIVAKVSKLKGVATAIAAAAGALSFLGVNAINAGFEIERMARLSNALPSEFQRWAAGAKSVGIEQDQLADILKDVNDRIGDYIATGGGEMADFFDNIAPKVGVTAEMFRELSGPQALQLYVDSLKKAGASQQDMTFYLEAVANDATALIPLLADGGVSMQRLGDRAAELGGILSDDAVRGLAGMKSSLTDLTTVTKGLVREFGAAMAPAVATVADVLTALLTKGSALRLVLDGLAAIISGTATFLAGLVTIIFSATSWLWNMAKAGAGALDELTGLSEVFRLLIENNPITWIYQVVTGFADLIRATGGWGNAMSLMGDVAAGVWEGVSGSAEAIVPALGAVWEGVKSGFFTLLSAMQQKWAEFLRSVVDGMQSVGEVVPGMENAILAVNNAAIAAQTGVYEFDLAAGGAGDNADVLREKAKGLAADGLDKARDALSKLNVTVDETTNSLGSGSSGNGLTPAAGGASTASDALTKAADRWRRKLKASLGPLDRFNADMAELNTLLKAGALSAGEHGVAVEMLADEFGKADPAINTISDSIGDFVASGLRDFDSLKNAFVNMLKDMVSMAVANPIRLAMGLSATGSAGTVAASAAGGGGGMLGNLLGLGNLGSGLMGGTGFLGGIGTGLGGIMSGGGLGASFANLGGLMSGSVGGLGAIGAALPALGIIAGVGALLAKGLSQKYHGNALRGSLSADGFSGGSFDFYKGGFLRGNKEVWSDAPDDLALYMDQAMSGVVESVETYADALGLSAKKIRRIAGDEFTVWLSGSDAGSQEEILAALQSEVEGVADAMAKAVLGTSRFTREGESYLETLTRLGTGIMAVNDAADLLGHRIWDISLASADAASGLVDLFGGVEAMTSAVTTYWQAFYTETERQETMVRRLTETFADLGYAMPRSRDQYRALVEAVDTTTETGRELYATLISMASAMDEVLPGVSSLTEAIFALQGATQTGLETAISAANEAAKANASAAADWYKASDSIRDYIDKLRGSTTALTDPLAARAFNEMQYQTTLASALAGDLDAAKSLTGVAENLRQSVNDTASTRIEAALAEARILSDLGLAAGVGDIEGARHDVIAGLLTDQADLMQEVVDYIADGNALTEDMIDTLQSQLGALDDAIAAAELINYQYLKERLAVTVDVLADADVPAYLRNLLTNAAEGVTGYIDFLVRSDLSPDLKWLAMVGASEHVKTIEYLAENRLGRDLTKLAVETVSDLEKTVRLAVGQELPDDVMRVALAGSSELSRIVNATLSSGIGRDAKKLALTDISDHLVRINGKIGGGNTKEMTRLLRSLGGVTDGKLTLGGSFVFDPSGSFKTWFERNTKTSIEGPMDAARLAMGTLTGALDELRGAIAAETARASYQSAVDALQLKGTSAASALASTRAAQSSTAEDLTALFAEYGVSTVGGGFAVKGGQLTETADHFATSGNFDPLMKALRSSYGVKGGTVAELLSAIFDQVNDPLAGQKSTLQDLRKAYRNLTGEAASFDGGGETGSWGRTGGVDGKGGRWGILHANEKISTSSQHDELVAEVRALREEMAATKKELAAFKEQSRQLDTNRGNDLRKIRLIEEARKADEDAAA